MEGKVNMLWNIGSLVNLSKLLIKFEKVINDMVYIVLEEGMLVRWEGRGIWR